MPCRGVAGHERGQHEHAPGGMAGHRGRGASELRRLRRVRGPSRHRYPGVHGGRAVVSGAGQPKARGADRLAAAHGRPRHRRQAQPVRCRARGLRRCRRGRDGGIRRQGDLGHGGAQGAYPQPRGLRQLERPRSGVCARRTGRVGGWRGGRRRNFGRALLRCAQPSRCGA